MEIGRTGLVGKVQLPFKLEGIFYFLRKAFVPFCCILLLDICLRVNKKRFASLVLIFSLIVGTFGSMGGISRFTFASVVFPAVLFLLFTSQRNNLSRKLFFRFSLIGIVMMACLIFLVQVLRNVGFAGADLTPGESLVMLRRYSSLDFFRLILSKLPSTVLGRAGGIQELLAVTSSNIAEIEIPFKMFIGGSFFPTDICDSVYGFSPVRNDTLAFGIAFGMWGQLFLSGSYLIVYFGTIFLVGIVICFEELFIRRGIYSAALLFAIIIGIEFWNNASMFHLSREIVLLFFCYFMMLFILKSISKSFRKVRLNDIRKTGVEYKT